MKKIVNGLRYDTENAIEIGKASSREGRSDFSWWEATLYKTARSGRFFIAGRGNAASRFSQSVGQNTWSGGSDLIPMTREEALEWAEAHLEADAIEEHFATDIDEA